MERKYIGNGTASLVYRLDENKAINVYYNHSPKTTKKIFETIQKAKDADINIPTPIELTSTVISEMDLKNIGLLGKLNIAHSILRFPRVLIGREFSSIIREYIPGNNLSGKIIPRKKIRKKVQEQMSKIKKAGMVIFDIDPKSFVLRNDEELFMVDFEKLYDIKKDKPYTKGLITNLISKYPPICMPQNFLFTMGYLFTSGFTDAGPMVSSQRYK